MALAARYVRGGTIDVADLVDTEPGRDEAVIEVSFTGICGTDLHVYHGAMDARVSPPAVIGHEMSGRIAELGAPAADWKVGDPVTVIPLAPCGNCPACRAGHSHVCHRLTFIGLDAPGSMQQRWIVPLDTLIALPAELPLDQAALIEPTAVAVHDVRRSELTAGEFALVVGGGPVGALMGQVARRSGASVLMLEPDDARRDLISGLGLECVDPTSIDVVETVNERTGGAGADVVFEVSGSAPGITTAIDTAKVRGRIVIVGIHTEPRPLNLHRVFWRELSILGARLYSHDDFEEAVRLVHSGEVEVSPLISHVVPLADAAEAFAALESRAAIMKVLIDCGAGT